MVPLNEVEEKVVRAIVSLRAKDSFLLEHAAHERSITHKLAVYLQGEFPQYNVDCEYNLHGLDTKRLPRECLGDSQSRVYPDIVVHLRGNDAANLLVIEAKPQKQRDVPACDAIKLREFTRQNGDYQYEFGLFVAFDGLCEPSLRWFVDGRQTPESLRAV